MNRRQLLTRIVQGFSLSGLALLTYPFYRFLFSTAEQTSGLELSIAHLQPGDSEKVLWNGRQVLVSRRTEAEMKSLASRLDIQLKDPDSRFSKQPVFAQNPFRSQRRDIFVTFMNCTHLGCEVAFSQPDQFNCPCHESGYDGAGRVYENAVAPFNLEIPNYRFIAKNILLLGG